MNMQKEKASVNNGTITDIHSHILPYIDDGAKDMGTAIRMASIASSEGIVKIIATPHFDPETKSIKTFLSKREDSLNDLKKELEKNCINVEIIPGAEVYLVPGIEELEEMEALCLGKSKYMLVEMPFAVRLQWLDEILCSIQLRGITPILAHPERTIIVAREPQILKNLLKKDKGRRIILWI